MGISVDSAFGVPEQAVEVPSRRAFDVTHNFADDDVEAGQPPRSEVGPVNSELTTIANTIRELQIQLDQANTRLTKATQIEATEQEIGRLFVEAQRFSEASLSKLELQIHEVLSEAEAKAKQILAEATQEAHEIREAAQQADFASTQTAQELQAAIVGFTRVNGELLKELGALNAMLVRGSDRRSTETESSSPVSEAD